MRPNPSGAIGQIKTMAQQPANPLAMIDAFGPHLAFSSGQRLDRGVTPDRLVKTHCCFCGQQCGIQLKVKDNEVIGFEPWEEFPFNRGMLCPKGRETLSARLASRPADSCLSARSVIGQRLPLTRIRRGDSNRRRKHPAHSIGDTDLRRLPCSAAPVSPPKRRT